MRGPNRGTAAAVLVAMRALAATVIAVACAAVGSSGGWLWALSCPPAGAIAGRCHPVVARRSLTGTITSLTAAPKPGSLPYQDFITMAAAAPDRLWIVTPNTFSGSQDGGVSWTRLLINPQGCSGQLDVWSGTVAWLLVPGAGLWGTSPGASWHEIS